MAFKNEQQRRWSVGILALCALLALWRRRKTWNVITHANSPQVLALLTKLPTLRQFCPPIFLPSGLLQTVAAERFAPSVEFRREVIELPEFKKVEERTCCPPVVPPGQVSLDWAGSEGRPIVILVPGLTGDSSSAYIRRTAHELVKANFRVACYNPRERHMFTGRGGNTLKSPLLYSVGFTEDLRRVVAGVRAAHPPSIPLVAVGFSLGSNYLAKYLGEEGEKSPLVGAVCVACPIDCLLMSHHLCNSWQGRLMDPVLLRFVSKVKEELRHVLQQHTELDLETKPRSMKEFDHATIAPMFGFSCASDYYRFSSAGLFLSRIRTPTLFLHAKNDPVIPGDKIPFDNFTVNPWLLSVMASEGGHSMDFPAGLRLKSWGSEVICEFATAVTSKV